MILLGSIYVGPIQFDSPQWLILVPVLVVLTVLLARRSLSGLGSATRWIALTVRVLVILLLAGALAEPQWRKESKDVSVTVIVDASESVPAAMQKDISLYIDESVRQAKKLEDRIGIVTAAKDAFVQWLPSPLNRELEPQHVGALDGTDLAAGVRLGMATMPKDSANRLLLITDGNETAGSLLAAAETAKAQGVPIDVLALKYKYDSEVLVDRLVAPASAREGETLNLRVVLQAVKETSGLLTVLLNDSAVDLDPDSDSMGTRVELRAGLNVLQVPIAAMRSGPQRFQAVFEPFTQGGVAIGDSIAENNKSLAVTFVSGEGKVLVLAELPADAQHLVKALEESKITADVRTVEQAPPTLTDLNAYDAIILMNESAYGFSQKLQEELRQYVHDTGGGLLMVGGPSSFGAGGWIGSPLEDALPIRLDPPQKRQMPRGALALVMHSVEAPDGVFLGKKVCEAAVNSLSRLDLAGIVEYGWDGGTAWVHKLAPVGDGTAIKRSIQKLMFGDMPDFTPSLELAYAGLKAADAGQRHVIMISDGDPSTPPTSLLDQFVEARITISTVGIYPHSGGDTSRMEFISKYCGGRHYHINTAAALAAVPQIFIKEAQTVRRSLIWEGTPFQPTVIAGTSESMRGMGSAVPAISGYVVTAEREGLALVSLKGKEGDPILAQWQYGLGKVVAYTSDASTRWNAAWVAWPNYKAFWEQHVRWAMRPGGSANIRVITENKGDQTVVTVEALDSKGERLNFANFKGRLALPDGQGADVDLTQVGPGRYQGVVSTDRPGSYVLSLRYAAPDENVEGGVIEGSVQAAVSRPFADEYRTLEDNSPLLEQVAAMTGGRVLNWDPARDDIWSRESLVMPVATRSIWLAIAVCGVGLFLVDVGVRRVRIDFPAMWRAAQRGFSSRKVKAGEQMGALKSARDIAKKQIAERATYAGGSLTPTALESEAKAAVREATQAATKTAKVKFEASPEALKKSPAPVALGGADLRPQATVTKPSPTDAPKIDAAEGMNRLLKAKQKAKEGMDEG